MGWITLAYTKFYGTASQRANWLHLLTSNCWIKFCFQFIDQKAEESDGKNV